MQFGIVIPVAGQGQFIGDALRSLQAQRVAYQLAVMDATPGDSVQKVVRAYHDIVSHNRHGPDAGQAAAIAEGWQRVNADILTWLCADDYYFPYTLDEVRHVFEARPDIDIVYGDTVFADEAGRFLGYFPEISEDVSLLPKSCCISQPSCFVRREAIEKIGGLAAHLHFVMDWNLWTRLYIAGHRFYYLRKPLAVCRMYRETKTASRSRQRYKEINAHLSKYTGQLTRLRSLGGFYYQDLLTRQDSRLDQFAYQAFSGLVWIKQWLTKETGKRRSCPALYGFERRTNTVQGRAEVWVPWFEETDRCQADIVSDRAVELLMTGPNGFIELSNWEPVGKRHKASAVLENISGQVVHLILQVAHQQTVPWRVERVEFRPLHRREASAKPSAKAG